jgi:hypothetical protein
MADYDPNDSGENYIRPLPQFLDNLIVTHPELGTTELWKVICWETSKLRNYMHRADSAGAIAEEAQKAPSGEPKRAPPLVADATEGDDPVMARILEGISDLEARLDLFEQRRAQEAERRERAEAALALAEEIAESAPSELMDALPASKQRLH